MKICGPKKKVTGQIDTYKKQDHPHKFAQDSKVLSHISFFKMAIFLKLYAL